jgi:hypothetical protein
MRFGEALTSAAVMSTCLPIRFNVQTLTLGYMTPAEYSASCKCTHTPVACGIN